MAVFSAYGTEMIRSALDQDVNHSEVLDDPVRLIAFHIQLKESDVEFVYANDSKAFEKHVLHHFVACNHSEKHIVLSIRGTLSLSGAIVDMQGMAGKLAGVVLKVFFAFGLP